MGKSVVNQINWASIEIEQLEQLDQRYGLALVLEANDIHIWQVVLDCDATTRTRLIPYLSEDEQQRAARFRFDLHRHHFVVARGCLRLILGAYLQQDPETIAFTYSDRGKPAIAPLPRLSSIPPEITFNLSHSGGMALYAISCDRPVGIDIEALRPMPQALQLAQRFFSSREYQQLSALPIEQQEPAFFRGWTRKEAYLKATGEGLAGLDSVEVSVLPHEAPMIAPIGSPIGSQVDVQWWIQDILLATPYLAAIVAKHPTAPLPALSYFQLTT